MQQRRMVYPDVLRAGATIFIVMLTIVADISGFGMNGITRLYGELAKIAVPLFVMISGMFLLDPNKYMPIERVLKKYFLRVIVAFFVWGFIYATLISAFSGSGAKTFFDAVVFVLGGDIFSTYLGYLMIAFVLYLLVPVLRVFVSRATSVEMTYLMIICFLPSMLIGGASTMNITSPIWFTFSCVASFLIYIGLFIAGFKLRTMLIPAKQTRMLYILGGFALILSLNGFTHGKFDASVIGTASPTSIIIAICAFLVIKNTLTKTWLKPTAVKYISIICKYSFGIFLTHGIVYSVLKELGFSAMLFTPILSVPVFTMITLAISCAITMLIYKIPKVSEYII